MKTKSILFLLLLVTGAAVQAQPNAGKRVRRQTAPTQTKLDDLKNPFDTLKTASPTTINAQPENRNGRRKGNGNPANRNNGQFNTDAVTNGTNVQPINAQISDQAKNSLYAPAKSYKGKNGNVDISFEKNKKPKNGVHTKTNTVNEAMCLTREEVRGQKIENEIIIADGSKAIQILPGGIIDANVLLQSGEFKFMNMTKRKPISLTTTSNLAIKISETAIARPNNDITDELRTKVHQLTKPGNIRGMPNMSSVSEASISTLEETTGINIGGAFFYMGVKATNNFKFSSEKYHYMYLYQFEQVCLPVIANGITSPDDIFTETTPMNNNWLYIQEVKYGRRLYVLMESEIDQEKYSNELNGKANWGAVSAALSVKTKGSSLSEQTNIRVYTQGGSPLAITDKSQVQKAIDKYFSTPFREMDIVPLSYKMTYMDGQLVSQVSNAFLDGKNCLDASKVRVRLKSIECKKIDDNKNNEEIYGAVKLNLFNTQNQLVAADARTIMPQGIATGSFVFGSKDVPINLNTGKTKEYDVNEQGKYVDVLLTNLDYKFEVLPIVHEKDNGFNADDDYTTENRMKKTLRQMLMEGTTSQSFEFRRKGSVIMINIEILPL